MHGHLPPSEAPAWCLAGCTLYCTACVVLSSFYRLPSAAIFLSRKQMPGKNISFYPPLCARTDPVKVVQVDKMNISCCCLRELSGKLWSPSQAADTSQAPPPTPAGVRPSLRSSSQAFDPGRMMGHKLSLVPASHC